MKKKIIALCLVIALAATAVAGATLAYFTDTKEVTNTFTVGNVEIKLDEEDISTSDENDRTEEGNQYTDIYPGLELVKDPTVTVLQGSEECYVRMLVDVTYYDQLKAAFADKEVYGEYWKGDMFLLEKLVDFNSTDWESKFFSTKTVKVDGEDENGDAIEVVKTIATYEFWYKTTVTENNADDTVLPALFNKITIPTALNNAELAELEGIEILVTANAIQAAELNDAAAAWAAFGAQH